MEASQPSFTAELSEVPIADVLQTLVRTRKDAIATIQHQGHVSCVWCRRGEIIDAQSPPLAGVDAVYRVLSLTEGCVQVAFRPSPRPRTVSEPLEALLLGHAQMYDEAGRNETPSHVRSALRPSQRERRSEPPPSPIRDTADLQDLTPPFVEPDTREVDVTCLDGEAASRAGSNPPSEPAFPLAVAEFVEEPDTAPQRVHLLTTQVEPPSAPVVAAPVGPRLGALQLVAMLVGAFLLGAAFLWWLRPGAVATPAPTPVASAPAAQPAPPENYPVGVQVTPSSARLWLDGEPVGVGRVKLELPQDGRTHDLRVAAVGYLPQTLRFKDVPVSDRIVLEPDPLAASPDDRVRSEHPARRSRRPAASPSVSKPPDTATAKARSVTAPTAPRPATPAPAPAREQAAVPKVQLID